MNENQNLRYDLLKANQYDVKNAKACYEFVAGNETAEKPEVVTDSNLLADGIYLMKQNGKHTLFTEQEVSESERMAYYGVGVKLGSKSLVVNMGDSCEDKTELAECKGGTHFITDYHEAVADWNGRENTNNMRDILSHNIELLDNEHIPSLGELYFILLHIWDINAALIAIGGKPLDDWYWSSTERSATRAWYLSLYNGYAGSLTKVSSQVRARSVSAFLPLNS